MPSIYQKKKKLFISMLIISLFLITFPIFVYAGDSGTVSIIEAYKEAKILENATFLSYFLKQLGWLLSKGLYYLVAGLETVILSINKGLGGFFSSPEFTGFLDRFKPLMIGLLTISIATLGFMFMFKPRMDKSKVVTNIMLAVFIIVGLPVGMNELYKLTNVAIDSINADEFTIADQILYENVTDVTLYDSMGMPLPVPNLGQNINLEPNKIVNIDPTETVEYKDMRMEDVWKYTVKYTGHGQGELKKNKKEKFGIEFTSTMYYRYKIDFFSIYVTLIISALALVLSGIKIARLLYELAINQSIAFFTAVTDLASGQRLKKCIEMILGTFVILFSCFFLLQLYVIGSAYCNQNMDNIFARLIALGALAWAVIDGPNLVERIVGIDAGINSAFKALSGTYMASKTIGAVSKGVGGFVKNAGAKTANASASMAGGIAGAVNGIRSNSYSPSDNQTNGSQASDEEKAVSSSVSSKSGASPISKATVKSNSSSQPVTDKNTTTSKQSIGKQPQSNMISPISKAPASNSSSTQTETTAIPKQNIGDQSHRVMTPPTSVQPINATSHSIPDSGSRINTPQQSGSVQSIDTGVVASPPRQVANNSRHIEQQNSSQTIGSAIKDKATNSNIAKRYKRSYELASNSVIQPYQKKMHTINNSLRNNNGGLYSTYRKTKQNEAGSAPKDDTPFEMGW